MRLPNEYEVLPVRRGRHDALACASVVGGIVAVVAAYLLGVVSRRGRGLDERVLRAMERWGAAVERPVHALIAYGAPLVVVIGLVVLATGALRRGDRATALRVVALVVVPELITQLLKLALPRPGGGVNTLPSGHVTAIAAFVVVLVASARRPARAAALGAVAVGASALAVMIVSWHRPSDIVAAGGVVAACFGAAHLVGRRLRPTSDAGA
ncbi:hypothetical protein [Actinomycetospora chiangmaiensis]|uniref:hypothetical protein n=1 Tax=Actinomycetospora chiangmaiensis TaxID=402650 RepID=UPI00036D0171|nr:hypothetical protein [Actinomycetospora chiangmaiensis]